MGCVNVTKVGRRGCYGHEHHHATQKPPHTACPAAPRLATTHLHAHRQTPTRLYRHGFHHIIVSFCIFNGHFILLIVVCVYFAVFKSRAAPLHAANRRRRRLQRSCATSSRPSWMLQGTFGPRLPHSPSIHCISPYELCKAPPNVLLCRSQAALPTALLGDETHRVSSPCVVHFRRCVRPSHHKKLS